MLSTAVPLPIVLTAYATRASGTPHQGAKFTTGEITLSPSLNANSVYLDQLALFGGSNVAAVCGGLAISAGTGLQALLAPGIGNCNGIVEVPAQLSTPLTPSSTNFLWLLPAGTFTKTTTNAPPFPNSIYVGAAITNTTGVTSIDMSGVCYDLGGAVVRTCSDTGQPADTPPSGCWFVTKTAGGTYIWDGGAYRQLRSQNDLVDVDNITIDYNGSDELQVKAISGGLITSGTISADRLAVDGTTIEDNGSHELQVIACPASGLTGTVADAQLAVPYIKADGTRAMTGNLNLGSNKLTNVANPTVGTDGVNLAYMQSLLTGLSPHQAVRVATTAGLPSYTVTGAAPNFILQATANGALTVDGVALSNGDRLLVQKETGGNAIYNLICTVTQAGNGSAPWIIAVATDSTTIVTGTYVVATAGTANANNAFIVSTTGTITVGTTSISWTFFFSVSAITAGAGLGKSGTTLDVLYDNTTVTLNGSNELEVGSITDANVATGNKDGAPTTPSMRTLGTGADQACSGNDARLNPLVAGPGIEITTGTISADVDGSTIELNGSGQIAMNSSYLCGLILALS